jgi:tetratricopeptide (TPR) repeat protein
MQRVDWKRAADVYERVRALAPEDERACLALVDLHYRFNRPDLALSELDSLLKTYRESGETERIFAVLEDAVQEREDDIPLRTRLAQVYLNAGRAEQALAQLDLLGDLQLEAGRNEEARATLRAIIALNPPNVADYRELLDGLG